MDLKEKLELIKRNTEEIVTEQELLDLLKKKKQPVTYCGYEPSGPLHLGHFSTIVKLMDLEKAGFKVKVLLADVHAFLNRKGSWEQIKECSKTYEKAMKAMGLKAEFFHGSDFQHSEKYVGDIWQLSTLVSLTRGTRSMQEVARDFKHVTVSQIIYPLMQAADIHHLGVDVANAAIEQRKVHMVAREVFPKMGWQPLLAVHTPMIASLQGPGSKMSSSMPNSHISVIDSEKEIKEKISKAYCPAKVVEDNPVIQIARLIVLPLHGNLKIERPEKFGGDITYDDYKKLDRDFVEGKLHPLDLKNSVAKALNEIIEPIRKNYKK